LKLSDPQPTDFSTLPVIQNRSRRDLYTIGIGIDALRFAKNLLEAPRQSQDQSKGAGK
jgi:hypothetical protein